MILPPNQILQRSSDHFALARPKNIPAPQIHEPPLLPNVPSPLDDMLALIEALPRESRPTLNVNDCAVSCEDSPEAIAALGGRPFTRNEKGKLVIFHA